MNPQSSPYIIGQFVDPPGCYPTGRTLYMPMRYFAYKSISFGSFWECTEAPLRWSLVYVIATISHLWAGASSGPRSDDCRSWSTTSDGKTYPDALLDGYTNVSRINAPPVFKLLIQKILNMGNRSLLPKSRERSIRQGCRVGDNNIRR
jgi:hypothetical protein